MAYSSRRLRRHLIVSACAAATGACLPLLAHASDAPASMAAAGASNQVGEVVVTAERRTVNVQSAPLAITAVPAEALDKSFINNAAGLNGIVPSLQITKASG